MYVGRFLVVAPGVGAYRVSSRSFPNRQILDRGDTLTVAPTADADSTDNPYVSYNCVRVVGDANASGGDGDGSDAGDDGNRPAPRLAVVGNGSHVDPVAEKLGLGYPPRDALASALLALDYEKDDYATPRIAGVVGAEAAWVGTVRRDALLVREVAEPTLVATYERDSPEPFALDGDGGLPADPTAAARAVYDLDFEHPVCAAGVVVDGEGVRAGFHNAD